MTAIIHHMSHYTHIYFFIVVLGLIAKNAWQHFILPAKSLIANLTVANEALKTIRSHRVGKVTDLDEIKLDVMKSVTLMHLWSEYCETLHPQKQLDEFGQEIIVRWRSTTMSETFFSERVLVDTPLKTEYYKHLPGILTGLGIIGTFSGLILGLMNFEVAGPPEIVRASLGNLIQGVGHSFFVSAAAIVMAMGFTYYEKSSVTNCYRLVEEFCQVIDSLFDAGAGEEYLERLVLAAESSATQSSQIKDALVADLKQILTDLTNQQLEASSNHSQNLSRNISQSFIEGLREPMDRISQAVSHVGNSQGEAVTQLITDVLANFSAQMSEVFGSQFQGMSDVLKQSTLSMQSTISRLDQIAGNMNTAGQGAADAMAEKLRDAITSMEARQSAASHQMSAFLEQMRAINQESQTETSQKMQIILGELGEKVSTMVSQLESQAGKAAGSHESHLAQLSENMIESINMMKILMTESQSETSQSMQNMVVAIGEKVTTIATQMDEQTRMSSNAHNESLAKVSERMEGFLESVQNATQQSLEKSASGTQVTMMALGEKVEQIMGSLSDISKRAEEEHRSRQEQFSDQTASLITALSNQVSTLSDRVGNAADAMRSSIVSLTQSSRDSIDRFAAGAETLYVASSDFAKAGQGVATTMQSAAQATEKIQSVAIILSGAAASVQNVMDDYKHTRETFANIVANLESTISNASREASFTSEIVSQLRQATEQLTVAQGETEDYLKNVTEVLTTAHQDFASNIERTLRTGNAGFHQELSTAVGLLKSGIQDFGDALDSFSVKG